MKKCEVYYFSDMQKCMTCGSCWDANDPYPPQCDLESEALDVATVAFRIASEGDKGGNKNV